MKIYRSYISYILIGALIYIVANSLNWRWDLTEDNRYSITPAVNSLVEDYRSVVLVESLFDGDFPSNYARLQEGIDQHDQQGPGGEQDQPDDGGQVQQPAAAGGAALVFCQGFAGRCHLSRSALARRRGRIRRRRPNTGRMLPG